MGMHLLIVGTHVHADPELDEVARRGSETETFKIARCGSPSNLVGTVRALGSKYGRMIDVLDIHDHGKPGHIYMGDDYLFHYNGTGRLIARSLRPLLTTDARVRLLGCLTACGAQGQQLLTMLKEELGTAVIYGTNALIDASRFGSGGFDRRWDDSFLFSSTDAVTRIAPDHAGRVAEIASWCASSFC